MKFKHLFIVAIYIVTSSMLFAQNAKELKKAKDYLETRGEVRFSFVIDELNKTKEIGRIISIDNIEDNRIFAYANEKEFNNFLKLGYDFKTQPPADQDGSKVINMANTVAEMANWDRYPTYSVYLQMMQNFANDFPNLCQLDTIGYSVNNRILISVKISDNVDQEEAEPEFFYTSTMHGDETTGFVLMLRLIDNLLNNYGSNTQITNLVDNIEIYINPNANPDGTYNGGNDDVSGATRYNANSSDLNRDFPDPRVGPNSPYQPETQAMMDYADEHNFVMSSNLHGGAEVMNFPWDTWTSSEKTHADDDWFIEICTTYVQTARQVNPNFMTSVTSSGITYGGDWYVISGGRQDYMTYFQNCREVTIEISNTKLLSSDNLPTYWNINENSLLDYMEACTYGFYGTVTDDQGNALSAEVTINNHDVDNSFVVTDPGLGDYQRLIEPGTYDVAFSSYGFISQTETVTINDYQSAVELNVVLSQSSTIDVSGTVYNGTNGEPVESATIELLDTPIDPVVTDVNGQYSINGILEDTYTFKVSHDDFGTILEDISVTLSNNVIDFVMYPVVAISFEDGVIPDSLSNGGDQPWVVDGTNAYHGTYSAQSGDISDDQVSELTLSTNISDDGIFSFFKKVSSEGGYDYLRFYIDGSMENEWSGEVDWSEENYTVSAGQHTFSWKYEKDYSVSNGSDCGWVDYIVVPSSSNPSPVLGVNTNSVSQLLFVSETITDTIILSNIGAVDANYTITIENASSNEWLSVSPESGTLATSEQQNVVLTFDATDISTGEYSTNLIIDYGAKGQITIPVSLEVVIDRAALDPVEGKISVYPMPFENQLNFEFNALKHSHANIKIFDTRGKLVSKPVERAVNKGFNKITIDPKLVQGIYFYKLNINQDCYYGKIIKN